MAYTTIDNPELYFQTKIYTADASANRLITLDGSENMQPDWVWLKNRNTAVSHDLYDSVRGATKYIMSSSSAAEATNADGLVAFNTNGFTVDTSWGNAYSGNGYVAWNWKAGGSASSNSNGSITSSVSANQTAGFSIVSYTGTGSNATVGHGLGVAPKMMIFKNRSASQPWCVYHDGLSSSSYSLHLDETSAEQNLSPNPFNSSAPTSTLINLGGQDMVNKSSDNHIAYCFAEKKGYSKFGRYTGNGNADGTFVYTGFKPAWLLIKQSSGAGNDWLMYDNKRDTFNVANKLLISNGSAAEATGQSFNFIDLLSNGFKLRGSDARNNGSGGTMIYMAFAESPFTNSSGVPTTAR